MAHQLHLENLTEDQKKAIASLVEYQKDKFFIGVSIAITIEDFEEVNALRLTDEERASRNQKSLFVICHYDPL